MLRSKYVKLITVLLLACLQLTAQQVLEQVSISKLNTTSYRVRYQLNSDESIHMDAVVLKIFRRREGIIDEIFSETITAVKDPLVKNGFVYDWKVDKDLIKAGDELQAKIILTYAPDLAQKKSNDLNQPPHADAGNFLELQLPLSKPLQLNGSKSYDADGAISKVEWKQIVGPTTLNIVHDDSLLTTATGALKEGTYAFELTVTDNNGSSNVSRMVVSVKPAPLVVMNSISKPSLPKEETKPKPTLITKSKTPLKGGPSNALVNLVVPGLGHYFVSGDYTGKNRKLSSFVVTALYGASIGGAFYFQSQSDAAYKNYTTLVNYKEYQTDPNGVITGVRGAKEGEADQYFNKAQSAHRNALICLGAGGTILIGDLIYTFIKGSKNKSEWKKQSTSFQPSLFFNSDGNTSTVGLKIMIK